MVQYLCKQLQWLVAIIYMQFFHKFVLKSENKHNFSASVQPTDLETLLDQVGLSSYLPVFHEQDVDLQVFLTLTDQDLKECGIQ